MNKFIHWLHHLFNPHCPSCDIIRETELERKSFCRGCEVLERQLEIERQYNQLLLNKITNPSPSTSVEIEKNDDNELRPIKRGKRSFIPFSVKEQMARENDEQTLILLKKHQIDSQSIVSNELPSIVDEKVEKLEAEILGTNVLANNG